MVEWFNSIESQSYSLYSKKEENKAKQNKTKQIHIITELRYAHAVNDQ